MKKKNKFFSVAMGSLLLLSAGVGCSVPEESVTPTIPGADTVLQICVAAKGYGTDFAYNLADAYNKLGTGVEARVVKTSINGTIQDNQLMLGPDGCKIDLFFTLLNSVFSQQVKANSYHWADLSSVYDSPAVGYTEADGTVTLEQLLDPIYVKNFTYTDGKQYALPYTSGVVGLLYNKSKWDSTNANLESAGKQTLELPKTTDEMFTLFNRMKTQEVKDASEGAYAFSYSGQNSYLHFMFNALWPQYMGATAAENFYEGKDENGVYTADIFKSDARKYAYEVIRKMVMKTNGYVSKEDSQKVYSQVQEAFIGGSAFFSINGDWMERETSKNLKPGAVEIEMIRTPVMSEIVENPKISADFTGTEAEKDAKLSSIIDFIDENYIDKNGSANATDAASLGVSLNTLEYIVHARLVRHNLVDFVACVPEYSEELDAAKDFLKFVYSKEGQEIMLSSTYGSAAPMTIDYSQMEYYNTATPYCKSRLKITEKSIPYGNANNYPMQYLGGLDVYSEGNMAAGFGGEKVATAKEVMMEEYNNYSLIWNSMMGTAGVSNQ